MKEQTTPSVSTSYKEVQIGKTLYRVTSVFTGEKDLGQTLEQLAVRRAMAELAPAPPTEHLLSCGWPHPCPLRSLCFIIGGAGVFRREPPPHMV